MNTPSAMSKFRSRSDKDHASFFAARNSFASSAISIWQCVAIKKLPSMLSKQSHLVQQWLKQTDSSNSSIQTNADFIVGIYGIKKNWSISIVGNSLIPFSIRRIRIEARFEGIQFVNLFHRKIYKYSNMFKYPYYKICWKDILFYLENPDWDPIWKNSICKFVSLQNKSGVYILPKIWVFYKSLFGASSFLKITMGSFFL